MDMVVGSPVFVLYQTIYLSQSMIAFSSLLVIGSGVANAGKLLRKKKKKSFLLREFLKSKCSSYGNVEQSCYRYSTRGHPETEADVEKLAGGECLGYYVFIAT